MTIVVSFAVASIVSFTAFMVQPAPGQSERDGADGAQGARLGRGRDAAKMLPRTPGSGPGAAP